MSDVPSPQAQPLSRPAYISTLFRTALASGLCALVAACASQQLEEARSVKPEGTEYSARLHANYLDLAEDESAKHGLLQHDGLAERAIAAAKGVAVPPFDPKDAGVPPDETEDLLKARDRLLTALEGGAPTAWSQQAARAQVMYDCWVLQKAHDHAQEDAAACRGAFFASIAAVERAMRERAADLDSVGKAPAAPTYFAIYFDAGSSALNADAVSAIADAVAAAEKLEPKRVTVLGYAGQLGVTPVSETLAQKRADQVAKELARLGVGKDALSVHSYRPAKLFGADGDGGAEAPSTRVDILLEE